jgi:hypothetical protein
LVPAGNAHPSEGFQKINIAVNTGHGNLNHHCPRCSVQTLFAQIIAPIGAFGSDQLTLVVIWETTPAMLPGGGGLALERKKEFGTGSNH